MTPHLVMEAHRLTAHNTLVSTVRRLNYVYGSRTPNVPDDGAYRAIIQGQQDRFPTLRGIGIKHCWSGYVSAAYDAMPVFGATGAASLYCSTRAVRAPRPGPWLVTAGAFAGRATLSRIDGALRLRFAGRQYCASQLQPPPRFTRSSP